jgi:hypothetical protein
LIGKPLFVMDLKVTSPIIVSPIMNAPVSP